MRKRDRVVQTTTSLVRRRLQLLGKEREKIRNIRLLKRPVAVTQRAASAASPEQEERREHVLIQRCFTKVRERV